MVYRQGEGSRHTDKIADSLYGKKTKCLYTEALYCIQIPRPREQFIRIKFVPYENLKGGAALGGLGKGQSTGVHSESCLMLSLCHQAFLISLTQ